MEQHWIHNISYDWLKEKAELKQKAAVWTVLKDLLQVSLLSFWQIHGDMNGAFIYSFDSINLLQE